MIDCKSATIVDLLDRVLDRGLVMNIDLIISVSGIPLIGVNLRAAVAGMDTMVRYGIMADWDQAIRAREMEIRAEQELDKTFQGDLIKWRQALVPSPYHRTERGKQPCQPL